MKRECASFQPSRQRSISPDGRRLNRPVPTVLQANALPDILLRFAEEVSSRFAGEVIHRTLASVKLPISEIFHGPRKLERSELADHPK